MPDMYPEGELPRGKYLTAFDLSAYFELDPHAIERLVAEGEFPAPVRIGGRHFRWIRSEIESYVENLDRFEQFEEA